MQYQMSSASVPSLTPRPQQAPTPLPTPPAQPKPRSRRGLWIALLAAALVAGAVAWQQGRQAPAAGSATGAPELRTGTVGAGSIERTIRLTGTTGAERFASLISPQMRGSRGDFGRDGGRSFGSGSSRSSSGGSSGSSSGGSSSGSSSSGSSSSSSASAAVASTAGGGSPGGGGGTQQDGSIASTSGAATGGLGGGSMSGAMRSSTSRLGGGARNTNNSRSSSTGQGAGASASLGAEGLGTTSGNLMGGGPGGSGGGGGSSSGGRGGGDSFGLTLQDVVKPGSLVKKGQTVAEFDRQYMLQRLDDYRTSVAQTEANLKKLKAEIAVSKQSHNHTIAVAKAQLEKARLDLKSTPVLGAIDSERLRLAAEEAEARYKQLVAEVRHFDIAQKAQLRNAELDTKQMEIEFKRAEANVDKLVTKAPIDGLTVMQSLFRGSEMAQIQAGDQLWPGMMFMQIVDTSSMVINATANQVDIERLKIGAKARVKFDAFPELTLPAHIYSIGAITRPGGMRGQFFKEIPIRLKLDKMDPRVIPDLSVSVDVVLEEEPNVAAVAPLASIFRDASDSRPYVYVKNGEAWERRNVELGLASNVMVTIRSGLKRGDVVALDAPEKKDGSPGA